MADVDYTELAELAYGQSYSSDVARRMFYGSKRTLDLLTDEKTKIINDSDIISEIDEKMTELRKERQKFFDQRREYSKFVASDARWEHLVDRLSDAAYQLNLTVGSVYNNIPPMPLALHKASDGDCEAVLVFSDWHYGLNTENMFNTYNTNICRERVRAVALKAAKKLRLHRCSRLHIAVLGDLFHGAIHTSARVASEEFVCDQIMQVSEILAQTIELLSEYVDETVVYMTYGNHARTIQNKKDSIHRDNMERLIPWWLEQRLSSYDNILIQSDTGTEFIFINSCGHGICASHGDNDTVKASPRLLHTLFQKKCGKDVEYILLGDKHHRESFEELGVESMLCGSLCGTDDYANTKRLYSTPSQLLLIINPDDGVDAEYRIKC